MPEEFLETAHVNFDQIMHGRIVTGTDGNGVRRESEVEQRLTADQVEKLDTLRQGHMQEEFNLLRSFVIEPTTGDDNEQDTTG